MKKGIKTLLFGLFILAISLHINASASGIDDGTNLSGIGRVSDAWSRRIYPGANYSRIVSNNGANQITNLVDFYPQDLGLEPVVTFGDYIYGGETVGEMVQDYENKGYKVVYAINGDSFFWNGIPKGLVIKDGIIHRSGASYLTALGFDHNNKAVHGNPNIQVAAYLHGNRIPLAQINPERTQNLDPAFIFTDSYGTTTKSTKRGVEVVVDITTPNYQGLRVETTVTGRVNQVRQVSESSGETPIKKGQVVLTAFTESQFYSQLSQARPGDEVQISVKANNTDGIAWENVQEAIGVFRPLKVNGARTDRAYETDRHPRTTVALRNDGFMRIMENDGRMSSARGLSYKEGVDFLDISAFDNVLAFDGGGSSTLYMTMPGSIDARRYNNPSDGVERSIGNALLFVKPIEDGQTVEALHIYPRGEVKSEVTMDAGSSIYLDTRATDSNFDPVKFDLTQVVYESKLGYGSGDRFVAGPSGGKDVITGKYPTGASGAVRLRVVNNIKSIGYKPGEINLEEGQSLQIQVQANTPSKSYILASDLVNYELSDDNLASIAEDGVISADRAGGQGTLKVSFAGHQAQIPVNIEVDASYTPIGRISGPNRFATASEIAEVFSSSEYAIIADSRNFPDALVAANLADSLSAPILLAGSDTLPAETRDSLKAIGVNKIIILGGSGSVPGAIGDELRSLGYEVERISGSNRYETAVKLARRVAKKDYVYLASGENYPDALSLTSLSTKNDTPILLTGKNSLSKETAEALKAMDISRVIIAGGYGAVSANVSDSLEALGIQVERIAGQDRYETSAMIARGAYPKENGYLVAYGGAYIDALTAGPLTGRLERPILLVDSNSLSSSAIGMLTGAPNERVTIIGGTRSVSDNVKLQIEKIVE